MDLQKHLSRGDLIEVMTLGHRSLRCRTEHQLEELVQDLKDLFHFENAFLIQTNIIDVLSQPVPNFDLLNFNYPEDYLTLYFENQCQNTDAVVCEFVSNISPVHWYDLDQKIGSDYAAAALSFEFNFIDGWTHGTIDTNSMDASVLYISSPYIYKSKRTHSIVENAVPFITEAYRRIIGDNKSPAVRLTSKELEVLNWIKEGKSSWDISLILNCSKRVIDFHANNIKKKLNSVTRAQAVAVALNQGIIDF